MAWLKQHWPLILMYLLIFGILGGLPTGSYWLVKELKLGHQNLHEYRLRWVIVTKEPLCRGDRVTKNQAGLQLRYLEFNEPSNGEPTMDTAEQTLASVVNLYALSRLPQDKPLAKNSLGLAPKLNPQPGNLIIPVSVGREYAAGLRPTMQLWFGNAGVVESEKTQVPQSMPSGIKGSKVSEQTISKHPSQLAAVGIKKAKTKEESPLVVSLRAIIPSSDNETAILYVEVPNADSWRVLELTLGNLVPIILPRELPIDRECPLENIRAS